MVKLFVFTSECFINISSEVTWFNKHIKIDDNAMFKSDFSQKNINHIGELFKGSDRLKNGTILKTHFKGI